MLKDDALASLAETHNVAQFVSVNPMSPPHIRHVVIRDFKYGDADLSATLDVLLRRSKGGLVNVRTFDPAGVRKSSALYMNIADVQTILARLEDAAAEGLYGIVNESIDVRDGGVSGVALPEVVEFAPDATPRVVESGEVLSAPPSWAIAIIAAVYGVDISDLIRDGQRIEFSVHPRGTGNRCERITVWEASPARSVTSVSAPLVWPNAFSRHIGDKAFGLLIADVLGLNVPQTTVISRRVAPFSFGRSTGAAEVWLRTAPHVPRPGLFTTVRGWADPFELLAREDPDGTEIASVICQEAVDAQWSGATAPAAKPAAPDEVHGVSGAGDTFMLGMRPAEELPARVVEDVRAALRRAGKELGAVRMEWAHDGERVWVLQMHLASGGVREATVDAATDWLDFDPAAGLDALRELVVEANNRKAGVRVTAPVGVTSHVGEILREAAVPAIFASTRRH